MTNPIAIFVAIVTLTCCAAGQQPACNASQGTLHQDQATQFYRHGNLASAIAELKEAINACSTEPFYRFMLANALYRSGNLRESARTYAAFLEERPYHFEGHMCLGFTLFELEDKQGAVDQWTAAMSLEPASPFARAALAVGLFANGDQDIAILQYERAVRIDGRYSRPDALAVDIRWKQPVRSILTEIQVLSRSQRKGD